MACSAGSVDRKVGAEAEDGPSWRVGSDALSAESDCDAMNLKETPADVHLARTAMVTAARHMGYHSSKV